MRREHDVLKLAKSGFEFRLAPEYVQARARNAFGSQRPHQSRFINCRAASRVDHK